MISNIYENWRYIEPLSFHIIWTMFRYYVINFLKIIFKNGGF
jgi:hypothetical protein